MKKIVFFMLYLFLNGCATQNQSQTRQSDSPNALQILGTSMSKAFGESNKKSYTYRNAYGMPTGTVTEN